MNEMESKTEVSVCLKLLLGISCDGTEENHASSQNSRYVGRGSNPILSNTNQTRHRCVNPSDTMYFKSKVQQNMELCRIAGLVPDLFIYGNLRQLQL
jgi:hypothetical protein